MSTVERILLGLTVLFLLGAGARLARPEPPPGVTWPEIPALSASTAAPSETSAEATMRRTLQGNLFSATRTAPTARFRVDADAEMEMAQTDEEPSPPPPPAPPPPARYRVAGTMLGGGGGFALIDADASSPAPETYRVGDAVGGYRLQQIAYDHVVLVGGAGEVRMDVAKPGETPRTVQSFSGPVPNAGRAPEVPVHQRAKSSANTPPGAIPPGW